MKRARATLFKLLYPPTRVRLPVSAISFTALILLFASGETRNAPAYLIYAMSAYSLCIAVLAFPARLKKIRSAVRRSGPVQKLLALRFDGKPLSDPAVRSGIRICQGMAMCGFYMLFRAVTGICYRSVWCISLAVYYFVLGGLRAYLAVHHRRRDPESGMRCYRRTAWLLLLLNIPMGGMIVLMVRTDSGFLYPGYMIYVSALYTFYTMIMSVVHIARPCKTADPVLSSAGMVNLVSAMMSVLGLQTAMIARFSENGENYRKLMNAVTGGVIWASVIAIAVYMLLHSRAAGKEEPS